MKKCLVALLSVSIMVSINLAQSVELRPDHPEQYTVKKGDTLWDIASMFLRDPWFWPEVWHINPQVMNPHLIYPGDILRLIYRDGQPFVTRVQPITARGLQKLQPKMRLISQGGAIPTIPLDAIKPFLTGAQVVSREQLDYAPYVVSSEGQRLIMGVGDKIYVRGLEKNIKDYSFFRLGDAYIDPESDQLLGYEAIHLGNGRVARRGDPGTVMIKERQQAEEVIVGDRLLPTNDDHLRSNFMPQPTPDNLVTKIISVYGGVNQIGQYDVVVLNKGEQDGVQVGHVQRIWQNGEIVVDRVAQRAGAGGFFSSGSDRVKLPDEPAGTMMVFRTFDKVSMALVLTATSVMHINDTGRSPNISL